MTSFRNSSFLAKNRWVACFLAVLLCSFVSLQALAQQANLPLNPTTSTPWVNGSSPSFTVTQTNSSTGLSTWDVSCGLLCSISSAPRAIDSDLTNAAQGSIAVTGSLTLTVADLDQTYSAGNFAGFLIKNTSVVGVALLGSTTIKTYLDGVPQETSTASSILGISSSLITGASEVGIYTTKPYNAVEITLTNPLTLVTTYEVFYAVQRAYTAGPALVCNTPTALNYPAFPTIVNPANTGSTVGGILLNQENAVDASTSNAATLTVAVAGSSFLSVKDQITDYPANTFAGFEIENSTILNLSILGNISINTFLNGAPAESKTNGAGLVSVGLLSSTGRQKVGFVTSQPFDEVQIVVAGAGLNLGSTLVYNAIFEKFCAGPVLVCNTPTSITAGLNKFPAIVNGANTGFTGGVSVGSVVTPDNVIDSDPASAAEISFLVGVGGSGSIAVKDVITDYPAGTYAGFDIENTTVLGLGLLSNVTISTYKDGAAIAEESFTGSSLLTVSSSLLSGNGRQKVGFVTTKSFDEVKITITLNGVNLGSTKVYSAVLESFCAGPPLVCNTPTHLTAGVGKYPVIISGPNTGVSGGISIGSVTDTENAIDSDPATFAQISILGGVNGSGSISVKDAITNYPAGTFAGFDISNPAIIGVSALSGLRIETFKDGVATGDVYGNGSLVNVSAPLLSGSGRQVIGFLTAHDFDEIKLTVNQTGVNLGVTQVYGAVFTRFCAGTDLACNTLTPVTNPGFPVYVNGKNTGITSLACVACTINNSGDAIDNDPATAATIVMAVGAASSGSFAVANAVDTYAATSFAGFDVETATLLSAGVLSTATISLYNNGDLVQTGTGNALIIGASTALLTGTSRQIVGLVATAAYDEVKITFDQVAGANLGNIKIYGAIFDKLCQGTIACNNSYFLTQPEFPVVINAPLTGVSGVACVGCAVQDPWNVISSSKTDFSRITLTANVGASAAISVVDPISTYPAGTAAGFAIRNVNSIAQVDLLNSITIETYNNGVLQESKAGATLLNLELLNIITVGTGTPINPSFITTKPFDEIRIVATSLASVINTIDIFGAFVDTRTAIGGGALSCNAIKNPDFNVTQINVPVPGNVSTNDVVPAGTTYGPTATAGGSNPAGGTLVLNPDGTYTFTGTSVGVYTYEIPVCIPETPCVSVPLVITVTDPTKLNNPPVANTDIASVKGAAVNPGSVTINVKANDGPGNKGGTLGDPTPTPPAHGAVSVVNGNIVYTPAAGYFGEDSFTYSICETPSTLCATTTVYVTVKQPDAANSTSAADDYLSTPVGVATSGNVSTNDTDPEGNTQSVAPQSITDSKGIFTLLADGGFTFEPATGFTGPVDFTYSTCDNGTPSACATATLHVLVKAVPDLTPNILIDASSISNGQSTDVLIRIENIGSSSTAGSIVFAVPKISPQFSITFSTSMTTANVLGGLPVSNGNVNLTVVEQESRYLFTIGAASPILPGASFDLGLTLTATGISQSTAGLSVNIAGGTAGETPSTNNTRSVGLSIN